jgi:hypothetical protein
MRVESRINVRTDRWEAFFVGLVALAAAAMLALAPTASRAADPGGSRPAGKSPEVRLENVPGSAIPRVILSAKAAERLGIQSGKVGEEVVVRKQMVSGVIIPPMEKLPSQRPAGGGFGSFGQVAAGGGGFGQAAAPKPAATRPIPPAAGGVWVHVTLSPGEWDRLAKDRSARILPLATRDKLAKDVLARPTGMEPLEDMKRSMLSLYYVVPGKDHGLTVNSRMRVELQLAGANEKQKVVPYGAVYYDGKGAPWVYVTGTPLTFQRERIGVERIVGDLAVLSEGPPVGTSVVTVGAALLYGAEIFKK